MTTLLAQLEATWRRDANECDDLVALIEAGGKGDRLMLAGIIGGSQTFKGCVKELAETVAQMTCENCRHWVPFDSFTSSPVCSELEVRMNRNEYCSRFQPIVAHTPRPTDTER